MLSRFSSLSAAVLAATISLTVPASSQEGPDPDRILATVDGTEITLGHVIALRATLPAQYDQYPAPVLFDGILNQLIQQTLLMQSHEGELSRQSRLNIENDRRATIAGEVIDGVMGGAVSDADLQAAYDEGYADAAPGTEYRAAHILVETRETAEELVAQLADGTEFATLAREHSIGPSGPGGGDLGWFSEGVMVEPFFEAVAVLDPGEVSEPVRTQFGWHVIKLHETRKMEVPALEEVRESLENELRQAAFDDYVQKLEGGADIERTDTTGLDPELVDDLGVLEN